MKYSYCVRRRALRFLSRVKRMTGVKNDIYLFCRCWRANFDVSNISPPYERARYLCSRETFVLKYYTWVYTYYNVRIYARRVAALGMYMRAYVFSVFYYSPLLHAAGSTATTKFYLDDFPRPALFMITALPRNERRALRHAQINIIIFYIINE